jgi:hypothetical protein
VAPLRRGFGTLSVTCFDFNRTTTSWFADELRSYVYLHPLPAASMWPGLPATEMFYFPGD